MVSRANKKKKKTRRGLATRTALLGEYRVRAIQDAVLDVVGREGLEGTSLQRIADRAGIAKGTIYLYFEDRDDLLQRTARFVFGEVRARVEPWLTSEAPFPERLRGLLAAGFTIVEQHRGFLRFYLPQPQPCASGHSTARAPRDTGEKEAFRKDLQAFVARAMRRGEIRRSDPDRLAHFIVDSANGVLVRRLDETHPPSVATEIDWLVDMLLRGMSPRGRSRS